MKKTDIENLKVVNGFVTTPGKFEGEPEWIIPLFEMTLSGLSDETLHDGTTAYDAFQCTEEMERLTGVPAKDGNYIVLWSDSQGFLSHMIMDEQMMNNLESFHVEEPTLEYFDTGAIQGFDDYPEYEAGY
jgi:hypothetical protein